MRGGGCTYGAYAVLVLGLYHGLLIPNDFGPVARYAPVDPLAFPDTRLAASKRYRVTITSKVLSSGGVALDQDASTSGNQPKTWTFTTGST